MIVHKEFVDMIRMSNRIAKAERNIISERLAATKDMIINK